MRGLQVSIRSVSRKWCDWSHIPLELSGFYLMLSNAIFRKKMAKALCHLNVPVTVVLDAAVG